MHDQGGKIGMSDLVKALANPTNQAILSLVSVEPIHPRRAAGLLSISESDASRRMRRLADVGLLESGWERVDGRNVKNYRLVADEVHVRIRGEGLEVETGATDEEERGRILLRGVEMRVPDPGPFVGRDRELDRISGPESVVLVEGIAGIGKTSLAAAWARGEQAHRPVFFHSFNGTESLTWLAHRVGVFMAERGQGELLAAVESHTPLAHQRELLLDAITSDGAATVLDAVEHVRDEDVRDLLRDAIGTPNGGKLVVTGRRVPTPHTSREHVLRFRLSGLSIGGVAGFLRERGFDASTGIARQVKRRLGGHPLATNLLVEATLENGTSLEAMLERVPDRETEEYLLREVHDRLSEPERRVLAHASIFRRPFTRSDLVAIYGRDPDGALLKLHRRRLIHHDGDRYRVHELLGAFFGARLADAAQLHEAAAEHALGKGTLEARVAALHHLLEAGKRHRVLALLERDLDLEEFDLVEEGVHNLYLDVLQTLAAEGVGDATQAGLVHDEMGDIHLHRHEPDAALEHYEEAKTRFQEVEARGRLADLAWKRALALQRLRRTEDAAEVVRKGLEEHAPSERTRSRLRELAAELEDR